MRPARGRLVDDGGCTGGYARSADRWVARGDWLGASVLRIARRCLGQQRPARRRQRDTRGLARRRPHRRSVRSSGRRLAGRGPARRRARVLRLDPPRRTRIAGRRRRGRSGCRAQARAAREVVSQAELGLLLRRDARRAAIGEAPVELSRAREGVVRMSRKPSFGHRPRAALGRLAPSVRGAAVGRYRPLGRSVGRCSRSSAGEDPARGAPTASRCSVLDAGAPVPSRGQVGKRSVRHSARWSSVETRPARPSAKHRCS